MEEPRGPQHTVRTKPRDRILCSELTLPLPPSRKCCSRQSPVSPCNRCASWLPGLDRTRIDLRVDQVAFANKETPGRIHRRPQSSYEAGEPCSGEPDSVVVYKAGIDKKRQLSQDDSERYPKCYEVSGADVLGKNCALAVVVIVN